MGIRRMLMEACCESLRHLYSIRALRGLLGATLIDLAWVLV